jgi:hypothetical protein
MTANQGTSEAATEATTGNRDPSPLLAARLRRLIQVIAVVGVVLVGIGLLPGVEVYDDESNCLGYALGSLGMTEHHHIDCTPSYTKLREIRIAGGRALAGYVVMLLAPAMLLYRRPSAPWAWAWLAWGISSLVAGIALWVVVDFHLDLFSHTRRLWPSYVVGGGVLAIQGLLLVGVPVAVLRSREPRVPEARVTEGGPRVIDG